MTEPFNPMTDLTLEQRMQYAIIRGGTMNESWRPVINDAVKVAEAYAAEQTAAQETRHTLALVAVVEEAQATIDSLRAQVERLARVIVIAATQEPVHMGISIRAAAEGLERGQRYVTAEYMDTIVADRVATAELALGCIHSMTPDKTQREVVELRAEVQRLTAERDGAVQAERDRIKAAVESTLVGLPKYPQDRDHNASIMRALAAIEGDKE